MTSQRREVPYFSQFETPELTERAFAEGFSTVLADDPKWQGSGAGTLEEYREWAWNVCGMACLKMVLAARTGIEHPTLALARECTTFGGYTVDERTREIRGLVYAPFVRFVRERFGLSAEVVTGLDTHTLPDLFPRAEFVIASVHSSIRLRNGQPPRKGGHLVLIFDARGDQVRFHNPGGHSPDSRRDVQMSLRELDTYFAGRGVAILR